MNQQDLWQEFHFEAKRVIQSEPLLASFLHACILNHQNFSSALSFILSGKMANDVMPAVSFREIFEQAYTNDPSIIENAMFDVKAVLDRDAAVSSVLPVLTNFKGFLAIQVHRLAHYLWKNNRQDLALFIQSRNSEVLSVDVHPAAKIGKGIMFDHATGIVVGETAVIEDNVSILQSVTLGGTGNESGDRHPKVRQGVMIGAGAKILGNIEIGEGAKVGAGSVVLTKVPAHTTVAGVPAKVVGKPRWQSPCETMEQNILADNTQRQVELREA